MGVTAVIYIQDGGVPADKQTKACLAYAAQHDYRSSIVPPSALNQALALIHARLADLVLLAYRGCDAEVLEGMVAKAGGRVEYCRPTREEPKRQGYNTDEIILRMLKRGGRVADIADWLGVAVERVRKIGRRMGC
jgi:hypothetical protein